METQQSWEIGGVKWLNPDKGKTSHNEIITQKTTTGICSATPNLWEDVSQNEIKTQKRKIRQGSTITNPDKMKSTSSEIKWIWIQGDRFIKTTKSTLPSCREGEVDGKPASNTQTTMRHHRSTSVDVLPTPKEQGAQKMASRKENTQMTTQLHYNIQQESWLHTPLTRLGPTHTPWTKLQKQIK